MVNVIHKSVFVTVLISLIALLPSKHLNARTEKTNTNTAVYFIENKGQITDQNHKQRTDIDYKIPAGGLNVFIGAGQMHYQWVRAIGNEKNTGIDGQASNPIFQTYRLDVILEGADYNVQPVSEGAGGYFERYYTGGMNGVVAKSYSKVTYKNIYAHIDWVLYFSENGLKYDFIVHPGGNAQDIKITYTGATNIAIEGGDITVSTPYGNITEKAPYTYRAYSKEPIQSGYILKGNSLTFAVAEYEGAIVIDPSIEWASYMGGSSNEFAYSMAADSGKNIYMVGSTSSASSANVFTSGAHQVTFSGNIDGYITKYAPGGARQWSTYYGGAGEDVINAIAVNSNNDIVFSGVTDTSYLGLATTGSHQPNHGGGDADCFLVKMNAAGQRQWATYYGGTANESIGTQNQTYLACDAANNIFLAGNSASDTGIATTGAVAQASRAGLHDAFVAKFNSNGVRQWGTYYGGIYDDLFTNIALDSNGIVYAGGEFRSDSLGTSGTYAQYRFGNSSTVNANRDFDALVAKFNPLTGARIWATYCGGSGDDVVRGVALGDSSMVYVSGSTQSATGIATTGAPQTSYGGITDAYLAKFDSSGQRKWGTYLGDNSTDHGGNVVIDAAGNPNVIGRTGSTAGIATPDGYRITKGGGSSNSLFDAMIAIYSPAGTKLWASYFGGDNNDYGYGIATAGLNHLYICGHAESDTGIANNGQQNSRGGSIDAFIAKFTPDTSVLIIQPFTQTLHCQGDSFVLNYGTTSAFRAGNTFTVQLSNSSGSFASPVNIGSKNSNVAGTINCGIPTNVSGTGFRIRIVGTAPIDTSYDNGVNITIKARPAKPVASSNSPVCSNDTLRLFSTTSTSGSAYAWTGPDNYNGTTQNSQRVNMNASLHTGNYVVTATLNGCSQSDTTYATIIHAAPKPEITGSLSLCSGDNLSLTLSNPTSGATVKWTGPNGFSDTIVYNTGKSNVSSADAGNYIVILRLNNCQSRDTAAVTVGPKPNPVTAASNSPVCTHQTLTLSANSSTPGIVYNWSGPGGFIANNQQNPQRTNLLTSYSGNYIVEADLLGCKVKDTISVVVNQSPDKPVATSNSVALCSGDDLLLYGNNITTGATASWTGPGLASTTGPNYTRYNIQVSQAGDYILKSEFGNGCAQRDTVNVAVTLSTPLTITANISPGTTVCPTADLKFYVTPQQPSSAIYVWSGPNSGNSDTLTVLNAKYADSGYYKVRVTTSMCAAGEDSVYLSVVDTISPPVLTLPVFDCEGDSMKVIATHPYLNKFDFISPGDSSLGVGGLTILNLTKSIYEGRWILRVSAGGCTAADTGYLVIRPKPAQPVLTNNSPLCEGEALNLSANSTTPGVTYTWQGPSGYNSTAQTPLLTNVDPAANAGYYIARSLLNGCFSNADSTQVIIHANPRPDIETNSPVCEGSEITLRVANSNTIENYAWAGSNAGFSGSGSAATVNNAKLSDAGAYWVTATSSVTGCVGGDTAYVAVIPLPGIPDAYYNDPLCEGKKLELNVHDTSTNVTYAWTGPNGFTFFDKAAFKNEAALSDSGMYFVSAGRGGKCYRSDSVFVRVKPTPAQPSLTSNSPLASGETLYLEVSNPVPGASFRWTGPANFGSFVQNPILYKVTEIASGTYALTTTLDGCSSSAITIVIVSKADAKREELILFPNPNNGTFTVKAKTNTDQVMSYEVINAIGMVVHRDIVQTQNQQMERKIEIDGALSSGVYFFRIMMSGQSREIPFSIVR